MSDPDDLSERAGLLAEEIATAIGDRSPMEQIEAMLLSAMHGIVLRERERCARLADERSRMWQDSRLNDASWPAEGRVEAQHRYREAVAIADAIRAGVPQPPLA